MGFCDSDNNEDINQSRLDLGMNVGRKRCFFVGLMFLTWIFWNIALFHCTFIRFFSNNVDDPGHFYGIFREPRYSFDRLYTCVRFLREINGARYASRAFGVLGYMCHTLALIILFFLEGCLVTVRKDLLWKIVQRLTIGSALFSVLIFVMFGWEFCRDPFISCVPGPTGILAIFNIFGLFAAVVLSCLINAPRHPLLSVHWWSSDNSGDDDDVEDQPVVGDMLEGDHENIDSKVGTDDNNQNMDHKAGLDDDHQHIDHKADITPVADLQTTNNTKDEVQGDVLYC